MKDGKWLEAAGGIRQLARVKEANGYTAKFGLSLTDQEAALLLRERKDILKNQERVEFGKGILPKLIYAFCDSPYIIRIITWRHWAGCRIFFIFTKMNPWMKSPMMNSLNS